MIFFLSVSSLKLQYATVFFVKILRNFYLKKKSVWSNNFAVFPFILKDILEIMEKKKRGGS